MFIMNLLVGQTVRKEGHYYVQYNQMQKYVGFA